MREYFKLFSYNFAKFSAKDIVEFVQDIGYTVTYHPGKPGKEERGFYINGTAIIIRPPDVQELLSSSFHSAYKFTASVLWKNYSDMYYLSGIVSGKATCRKNETLYKEHEMLFMRLKRKFKMSKEEDPKAIKNLEFLQSLPR